MPVGVHGLICISTNQNIDLLGFCNWFNLFKQHAYQNMTEFWLILGFFLVM